MTQHATPLDIRAGIFDFLLDQNDFGFNVLENLVKHPSLRGVVTMSIFQGFDIQSKSPHLTDQLA